MGTCLCVQLKQHTSRISKFLESLCEAALQRLNIVNKDRHNKASTVCYSRLIIYRKEFTREKNYTVTFQLSRLITIRHRHRGSAFNRRGMQSFQRDSPRQQTESSSLTPDPPPCFLQSVFASVNSMCVNFQGDDECRDAGASRQVSEK